MATTALQIFKAQFFRALSHPVRIKILEILISGDRSVQELQEALKLDQPVVSQQLAVLRNQGIVVSEKKGLSVRDSAARSSDRGTAGCRAPHFQQPSGDHARHAPRTATRRPEGVDATTFPERAVLCICRYALVRMLPPHGVTQLMGTVASRRRERAGPRRLWIRWLTSSVARCKEVSGWSGMMETSSSEGRLRITPEVVDGDGLARTSRHAALSAIR